MSPWTGNGHEVGQQFTHDGLDLFVVGFAKDTGEDSVSILVTPVFVHRKEFLFLNSLKGF